MHGTRTASIVRTPAATTNVRWLVGLSVGLLTLLAFGVRAWQADWSLPWVPHPDEPAIMNVVMRMLRTGDLNPHFFDYPSFWMYVQALVGWVHLQWGTAQGLYVSAAQLPATTDLATSAPGFFAWGRVATATAGALTVPALYSLGRRVSGQPLAGIVAAALLVVNAFHIGHAHFITTDVASEFFVALALIWTLNIHDRGAWRDYLMAGALTGLAASTKYQMALTAVAITLAHGLRWRKAGLRQVGRLVWAGGWTIAVFLLASPYIVLAWSEFRAGLAFQLTDYGSGHHGDVSGAWPIGYYLRFFWWDGVGPLACLVALWGTWQLARRRDWRVMILWSFVLVYVLTFLAQGNHWMRNIIATQLPLFTLAGVGAADLLRRVGQHTPRPLHAPLATALLLALLLPTSVEAFQYTRRLGQGDTRVQAARWIETLPPGLRVAAELKTLPGAGEPRWTEVHYLPLRPLAWYRQQGYAYVIGSSDTWEQWSVPSEYVQFGEQPPLREFGGNDAQAMLGPHLVVYNTGLQPSDVPQPTEGLVQMGGAELLGVTMGRPDGDEPMVGIAPAQSYQPGDVLALRTWWQVAAPLDRDYLIFVHVLDAAGNRVTQRDTPPWQGRFPTTSWRSNTMVIDVNDVALPPTLPAGSYTVVVGMFDPASGAHPAVARDGAPWNGAAVPVATITVE